MINQKHLKTTGNVLRRSYLPNDQSFWSLDLFVKDTYWWSLHDSTREEVKESTTKWTTQNKQGKLPQTQLPISHKSLLPHPGTLGRKTDAFLGVWSLLAVTEIFSSWCLSPRPVKTNPWTCHQCACQTTTGVSTSLHSCDDQCHNTVCLPGLVYAAPTWPT